MTDVLNYFLKAKGAALSRPKKKLFIETPITGANDRQEAYGKIFQGRAERLDP